MVNKKNMSTINNKWFMICGAIAGLFFTLSWIIQEALRVDYNPLMHPISSLAYGPTGWMQVVTFFIAGVLILLFGYGVWKIWDKEIGLSQWAPIFLIICAISFIGSALFTADFANGYPAGAPVVITNPTFSGIMHQSCVTLMFFSTPMGCFVLGNYFAYRKEVKWFLYSFLSGFIFLIFALLTAVGFYDASGLEIYSGILQRITITTGFLWMSIVSIYFFKKFK